MAAENTVRILDKFYDLDLVVNAYEYDIVYSFFNGFTSNSAIAKSFTEILFRISNLTEISVIDLLESFQNSDELKTSLTLAYYLNSVSNKTVLYGVNTVVAPNNIVQRNIIPDSTMVPAAPPPPPPIPVADFIGNPLSGDASLTVNFTDTSTNSPTSWAWDFNNDGIVDSTLQNPIHTYSTPGTYSVKLTATNDGGGSEETKIDYINVTQPCVTLVLDNFDGTGNMLTHTGEIGATWATDNTVAGGWFDNTGGNTFANIILNGDGSITPDEFTVPLMFPSGSIDLGDTFTLEIDFEFGEVGGGPYTGFLGNQTTGESYVLNWFVNNSYFEIDIYYVDGSGIDTSLTWFIMPSISGTGMHTLKIVCTPTVKYIYVDDVLKTFFNDSRITSGISYMYLYDCMDAKFSRFYINSCVVIPPPATPPANAVTVSIPTIELCTAEPGLTNVTDNMAWYKFVLTETTSVVVDTLSSDPGTDTAIGVYDSVGNLIDSNYYWFGPLSKVVCPYLDPGTYYVAVGYSDDTYFGLVNWLANSYTAATDNCTVKLNISIYPPYTNFTGNPLSGSAPLTVSFTDESAYTPTSWAWDFNNDGVIDSTDQNPTHIYSTPGTYSVKLTSTNAGGSGEETKIDYITVAAAPPTPPMATHPIQDF